jgi:hypothetical protein
MKNRSPEWIQRRKIYREKVSRFTSTLDEPAKHRIVKEWVNEYSLEDTPNDGSECERQLSMCMSDPDLGWEMILRIAETTESRNCLSRLGAWHLEEWLAHHGELVIGRVEDLATQNISFKRLLSCVYQNSMPPKVYERVKAAALYDDYFRTK